MLDLLDRLDDEDMWVDAQDDAIKEIITLRARITELEAKLEAMRETYTLAMRGAGLERYGIEWQGQENPISVPMDDGYWTPWHIAQLRITELEAKLHAPKYDKEICPVGVNVLEWIDGLIDEDHRRNQRHLDAKDERIAELEQELLDTERARESWEQHSLSGEAFVRECEAKRNEANERVKELEAQIRPAEGLPSYKELVERGYLTWALLPGESIGELKQKLKILLAGEVE